MNFDKNTLRTTCIKNETDDKVFPYVSMRGSRKFCQRGSNFDNVFFLCVIFLFFFFLTRGGRIQVPLLAGHHRPAGICDFLGDPDLYCSKTQYFCVRTPCPSPSGSAHGLNTQPKNPKIYKVIQFNLPNFTRRS